MRMNNSEMEELKTLWTRYCRKHAIETKKMCTDAPPLESAFLLYKNLNVRNLALQSFSQFI